MENIISELFQSVLRLISGSGQTVQPLRDSDQPPDKIITIWDSFSKNSASILGKRTWNSISVRLLLLHARAWFLQTKLMTSIISFSEYVAAICLAIAVILYRWVCLPFAQNFFLAERCRFKLENSDSIKAGDDIIYTITVHVSLILSYLPFD